MGKFAIFIVKWGNNHFQVFNETALSLYYSFKRLGCDVVITDNLYLLGRRYIILGANMLRFSPDIKIRPDSIIYQLEREDSPDQFDAFYLKILKNFKIWDFSPYNMERINSKYNLKISEYLPLGYVEELNCIKHRKNKDIDILFIGSTSRRRKEIILELNKLNIKSSLIFNSYGKERDELISRSKIMLNVHRHGPGLIEHVRVFYYLNNDCLILSENSNNGAENEYFSDVMFLSEFKNISLLALEVLNNKLGFEKKKNIKKFMNNNQMHIFLSERLKSL